MSIKNNIIYLQSLLEQVNNLPEAENLNTEISTQATLLSEQDAKIAELAQVLAGKASGGSVETVTITISSANPDNTIDGTLYYVDGTGTLQSLAQTAGVVQVMKNSLVFVLTSGIFNLGQFTVIHKSFDYGVFQATNDGTIQI